MGYGIVTLQLHTATVDHVCIL